jgi:hypothetical protein
MRQGELFSTAIAAGQCGAELPLQSHQLLAWQERIATFQAPLFAPPAPEQPAPVSGQAELFSTGTGPQAGITNHGGTHLNPLELQPQALSFWRWPQAPQQGAALYFVVDRPPHLATALLLYVGETVRADRRWKGEHDCKSYLSAYGEALQRAELQARLTIRFWLDVPGATQPRRALEQALIRRWQPPFNKETRGRWATPFQAESA